MQTVEESQGARNYSKREETPMYYRCLVEYCVNTSKNVHASWKVVEKQHYIAFVLVYRTETRVSTRVSALGFYVTLARKPRESMDRDRAPPISTSITFNDRSIFLFFFHFVSL